MKRILLIIGLTALFVITLGSTNSNASSWHKGNPPMLNNHQWVSEFKINGKNPASKYYYLRYVAIEPSVNMAFNPMSIVYNKNKKFVIAGDGTANESAFPYYRKIGKNLYQIIFGATTNNSSGFKEDLKSLNKFGTCNIVKVYNNDKVTLWNGNKGKDGKIVKSYVGTFSNTNKKIF